MSLLKRFLAAIIDLTIFSTLNLFFSWVLTQWGFWDGGSEFEVPLWLAFFCCILIPTFFFERTLGERWLNMRFMASGFGSVRIRVAAKYFILCTLVTFQLLGFIQPITDLLTSYSYIQIGWTVLLRLDIVLILSNWIVLIWTGGHSSGLDRIFGLELARSSGTRRPISELTIGYIFSVVMIIGIAGERRFNDFFNFRKVINKAEFVANEIRFPAEVFDAYTAPGQIYYQVGQTNLIVTNSDRTSFVSNEYLYQRQLQARVQDDLVYDARKREELCGQLIDYCNGMIDLQDTNALIMQTKIELVHIKYYAPWLADVSIWMYYFDDKAQAWGLYGGYSADSLNKYYIQTRKNCIDSICRFISSRMKIPMSDVLKAVDSKKGVDCLKNLPDGVRKDLDSLNLSSMLDKGLGHLQPIPFESVKGKEHLVFMYPMVMFDIFGTSFYDTQFIGAMALKNTLFQGF
ncbi:MAG TPA: hypothetical protein VGM30_19520 [Puia sp.]|jgi:hypothetical protein